ncbi:PAS domain S-box protein [Pseudoduganella sp. GCM10020061]|uniref:PAS domain-containing sensor histidine kinase n=1 Tax=Pseudoduganella sp. GCM10020061 TaxID=3317345 RepID=UPI00363E8F24
MNRSSVESLSIAGIAVALMMPALAALSHRDPYTLAALIIAAAVVVVALLRLRGAALALEQGHNMMRLSQQRYQRLIDTAHEGIWLVDPYQRSAFANPRLAEMFGESVASIQGRSVYDFLGADSFGILALLMSDDPRLAGRTHDLSYRRANGETGWAIASGRPMQHDDGTPAGTLLMLTDITERKNAELALAAVQVDLEARIRIRTADLSHINAQLREQVAVREAAERALAASEQRMHEIISAMPVALMLKDADSRIILMNSAAEEMCGFDFASVAGTRALGLLPAEQLSAFEDFDRAAFEGRTLLTRELHMWDRRRGGNRLLQDYRKPVFDADGKPLMMICMAVDITQRKRTEEALAESLAQLRQLSAHQESIKEDERKRIALDIHDELGQNLMALKLDVTLLHQRTATRHPRLNARAAAVLETIDATIRSVRAIINDLHPSTLELGLCPAVEWLLGDFGKRNGIETRLVVSGGDGAGLGQRRTAAVFRAIQESLVNVMRHANATRATVEIEIGERELMAVVEDDGVGIEPGQLSQVHSFGLRGMRERLGGLGGSMAVASSRGMGTRVEIRLPLKDEMAPLPEPAASEAQMEMPIW